MKKILFFFLFFFLQESYAQQKNIYVEYTSTVRDEEGLFKSNEMLRQLFEDAMKSKLRFGLIVNNYGSKFYNIEQLNGGMSPGTEGFALTAAGYLGMTYFIKDTLYSQSPMLGENIYHTEKAKEGWTLRNETKMISGFLCYKATNIYRVVNDLNPDDIKVFNHPVTAWYCPKLPYRHGPLGYGNLPGLILELQVRNVVYGVTKIDLKTNLNFDTKFLESAKILNEEELKKALDKMNDFEPQRP